MGGHHYMRPIRVKLNERGQPVRFRWYGAWYPVSAVLSTWRLMDRWWEQPRPGGDVSIRTHAQDRTYFRVLCSGPADEQVFDLYYDAVTNSWVLDTAHD
jgi:hypothetical protein